MQFARREPRIEVSCEVLVTPTGQSGLVGTLVDVSSLGAGLLVPLPLARGTRLTITLFAEDGALTVSGLVTVLRSQSGEQGFRIGVELDEPSPGLVARAMGVGPLARGTGSLGIPVCLSQGGTAPLLASTGPGRERLYQHARERLAAGDAAGARRAVLWAVQGDPRNVAYRIVFHHAAAAVALAEGNRELAEREIKKALAAAPDDAALRALADRIAAPPPRPSVREWLLGRRRAV